MGKIKGWKKERHYKLKNGDEVFVYNRVAKEFSELVNKEVEFNEIILRIEQYTNTKKNTGRDIPNNWRVSHEELLVDGSIKNKWFSNRAEAIKFATNYMRSQ